MAWVCKGMLPIGHDAQNPHGCQLLLAPSSQKVGVGKVGCWCKSDCCWVEVNLAGHPHLLGLARWVVGVNQIAAGLR